MVLINLLPHREAARQARRQQLRAMVLLSLLSGLVVALLQGWYLQQQVERQQARNRYLQSEIALLDTQIKTVAGLEGEIAFLRARLQAMEALQSERNFPVYWLAELARQVPGGMHLSQLRQQGRSLEIKGVAQSGEQVAEMLRHMAAGTTGFAQPELQEMVAGVLLPPSKEQRKVVNFQLRVQLGRAAEAPEPVGSEAGV
jgi:type IV pilus assembly protein PilN